MKTIIVATDFSYAGSNAVAYAADMAVSINAPLCLLHVCELRMTYPESAIVPAYDDLEKDALAEIAKLKNELIKRTGNKISISEEVRTGIFFEELKSSCEKIKPYMVIMGSQGTTAAEHVFFGSHTVYAMKHLQWSLLTVPLGFTYASIKRIGLACDLENVEDTVPAEEISTLLHLYNAELHIINTGKKGKFVADIIFQSTLLEQMLLKFNPQFHFISASHADAGILDFVEKNAIDLLITLPKRHNLLDSILHKSNSKQFILHSQVPVMILH